MIIDYIRNASLYQGIDQRIQLAFEYLAGKDFTGVAPGRYDIDGDNVFALVQQYQTKPREKGLWEAHQRYIDVQFVASGVEVMGYAPISQCTVTQPYSLEKDCGFFSGSGDFVTVRAGMFTVFFPEDVHMPCLISEAPVQVYKVVVKVKVP
ncbi:MAG: YhcH/YjgK/YiaL family protein [bacterium]